MEVIKDEVKAVEEVEKMAVAIMDWVEAEGVETVLAVEVKVAEGEVKVAEGEVVDVKVEEEAMVVIQEVAVVHKY